MSFNIKRKKSLTLISIPFIAIATLGILAIGNLLSTKDSDAISGWDAGNIISDSVFTNKGTMNTSSIQDFLNSKVSHCDTWGEQTSEFGGGTRRQWAEARGYSPPYTCLKDYSQHGKSAAQIIYDAAQEFTINPQVLLVLLQKEQSLVTDTWPLSIQYRSATGYGCPDTAACDSEYYGFTNQVRWAARMFRAILNDSPTWYTPYELGNNFIRYSPDASCGGSNVYIQNRATQALYNYTPYQPNQDALNAGWGTAHCGAYGNRNFYLYFTTWFGSTKDQYRKLSPPRWLQVRTDTQKTNLWTTADVGGTLVAGRQLKFIDKILIDNKWYARTASDYSNRANYGVLLSDLEDIPYTAMSNPKWLRLKHDVHKRDPRAERGVDSLLQEGRSMYFESQITVNGTTYLRTSADTETGVNKGIPQDALEDVTYQPFAEARWLRVKNNTPAVNPLTGQAAGTTFAAGTQVKFTSKMLLGNTWYYRSEAHTNSNTPAAIPASSVENIPYSSIPGGPKLMRLTADTTKVRPSSGEVASDTLLAGREILFGDQITINGVLYYRTTADVGFKADRAIRASNLEEVS
jgi:hypothetical protein